MKTKSMKILNILLFILIVFGLSLIDVKAALVKCVYNLSAPQDEVRILTQFAIYFDPDAIDYNSEGSEMYEKAIKYLRYKNKAGNLVDWDGYSTKDYYGFSAKESDRSLENNWERRGYCYKNVVEVYKQDNICADMYVYNNNGDMRFSISGTNSDGLYSDYGYIITTNKSIGVYVCDDDGENCSEPSSENQNNSSIIKSTCTYNFGTAVGYATQSNHLNIDLTIEKVIGIEIHDDVKNSGDCGRKGYSYGWDDEKNYCYSKNSISYNLLFSSPDNQSYKHDYLNVDLTDNTLLFNFGASSFTSMNNLSVIMDKKTILKIFESGECLDKHSLYLYRSIENAYQSVGGWQFVITHNRQEAEDSQEEIFDGDSTIDNEYKNAPFIPSIEQQACESLLGNPDEDGTPAYYLQIVFNVMKYVGIVLLIVTSSLDFFGAIASQDDGAMKKVANKCLKRLIYCAIIFFIPVLLNYIFVLFNIYSSGTCGIS